MNVTQGSSLLTDAAAAVQEAAAPFQAAPDILFAFCSTEQSPTEVQAALSARFPGVPIAGCTTAGEQLDGTHTTGALVLLGATDTGVRWSVEVAKSLETQDATTLARAVSKMADSTGVDLDGVDPEKTVCMLFIDGLRGQEERFSAELADALQGIPLAGGSAGDDLQFAQTSVFAADGAHTNAAVMVLAHSVNAGPIRIVKHQHFTSTPASVVVTKAEGRVVHEFDGFPALDGYASALGLAPEDVTPEVCFSHPVTFACNGELYVRSIQSVLDDGSIQFYCAVEEGMVLEIGGHHDMRSALAEDLEKAFPDGAELMIGFNCILRALEATGKEIHGELGEILASKVQNLVGFDTYGEQLNGLHINQTLVAVGFGASA